MSLRYASPEPAEGQAARPNETMEGIGAAAQDYRSVPQLPRCPSWWPDEQRNGEPCALKGASTVRGEALGRPGKRRLAPKIGRASCRERGWQSVLIGVVAGCFKQKKKN